MSEARRRLYAPHLKAPIAAALVMLMIWFAPLLLDALFGEDITAVRIANRALLFVVVVISFPAPSLWAPTPWSTERGSVLVGSGVGTLYTLALLLKGGPLLLSVLIGLIIGLMCAGLFAWQTREYRQQQRTVAPGDARDTSPPSLQV